MPRRIALFFCAAVTVFSCVSLGFGEGLPGVLVRNRENLQKNTGAYSDASYRYCDDKEIAEEIRKGRQQGTNQYNLCSQNISKGSDKKKVVTAVDVHKDIEINNAPGSHGGPTKVNLGVVDAEGGLRGRKIATSVNTKNIDVK